jgi:hypothetical protein
MRPPRWPVAPHSSSSLTSPPHDVCPRRPPATAPRQCLLTSADVRRRQPGFPASVHHAAGAAERSGWRLSSPRIPAVWYTVPGDIATRCRPRPGRAGPAPVSGTLRAPRHGSSAATPAQHRGAAGSRLSTRTSAARSGSASHGRAPGLAGSAPGTGARRRPPRRGGRGRGRGRGPASPPRGPAGTPTGARRGVAPAAARRPRRRRALPGRYPRHRPGRGPGTPRPAAAGRCCPGRGPRATARRVGSAPPTGGEVVDRNAVHRPGEGGGESVGQHGLARGVGAVDPDEHPRPAPSRAPPELAKGGEDGVLSQVVGTSASRTAPSTPFT